jgi:hypothetical protein
MSIRLVLYPIRSRYATAFYSCYIAVYVESVSRAGMIRQPFTDEGSFRTISS